MKKVKVMSILGTRPEIIRLSETLKKLDLYTDHILVHTNQNFDYELNQIFFEELNLRKPKYILNVKSETIGGQIGNIISQTEKIITKEKPDAVLILGDTNSSLSCIVAKRLKIPIFHMEAGNRSFDDRVPEEINRRIIDHTSDINLPYTEHARRNLLREGLKSESIFVTGSPMAEVIKVNEEKIENSKILEVLKLKKEKYFVVSIHREENVGDKKNLEKIANSLNLIAKKYKYPLIFSTHPRTRKKLKLIKTKLDARIIFHKPFGIFDYIKLQKNAYCNLSDSGTIHEDSGIMGITALNIRESNERQEAYDTGNVIMTGLDPQIIMNSIEVVIKQKKEGVEFSCPYDYQDTNVSEKVVRLIIGLNKLILKKKYHIEN